ncbi:MAG: beta-ketoacyl-ACP synthase III [Chloroflexota bacterium]|nr:beta-ketoacyl-ACP synthase III [Chloroflexota bacterium]
MPNAHIVGWGKYLPGKPITTADLAIRNEIDLDAEKIADRTGIHQRHFAGEKDSTSTLAIQAAHAALEMANVDPAKLDLIILGTNSPDNLFPATAFRVQAALGAIHAGAFDLSAGCPGFLYGLIVAGQFIRAGAYKTILVIGADCVSVALNPKDPGTCAYFGDGAGAVVLAAREDAGGLQGFTLGADGSGADLLVLPAGGSRLPLNHEVLDQGLQYGRMDGGALYRFGTRAEHTAATEALKHSGLTVEDVDLFIPHQSNARLIQQVASGLKIPPEKVFVNIDRYANTSAAALPLALCDAVDEGRLKPGDHVLLAAYGAGLAWAGAVVQWDVPTPVKPLPGLRRAWHAILGFVARQRTRLLRLSHWLDRFGGRPQS